VVNSLLFAATFIEVRLIQPLKPLSILVTLSDIVMLVRLSHQVKALALMLSTPFGMVKEEVVFPAG
jgi:hypothetical protein